MTNTAQQFIVWDWNGTLIDDLPVNLAGCNSVLTHFGKTLIDTETYQKTFAVPIKNFCCATGFSPEEYDTFSETIQHIFHDTYQELIEGVGFREGVRDLLGITCAQNVSHIILSNHLAPCITQHLTRLDSLPFFWDILAHADRAAQMSWLPKGDRLKTFVQEHALKPENGLIIGDTPEEMHIAQDYGLIGIALTGGHATTERLEDAHPDYLIHSFDELYPILREKGFVQ